MVPNGYFVSRLHIYIPVKVGVTERGRSSKFISVPLARMVTSPPVPNLLRRLKMCFYFRGIEQRRWLGNERWISHPKCLPEREMYEYSSAHFWHIGNMKSALNIWMSSIHLGAFPLFKKFPYNILGRLFIKNLKAFLKCNQLSILLQICTYIITYIKKKIFQRPYHCCFLSIWFMILHPKSNSVNLVKVVSMILLLFCTLCFSDGLFLPVFVCSSHLSVSKLLVSYLG